MHMIEFLVYSLVAAVIITFITLVGHGFWLMGAGILEALFGIGRDADQQGTRCGSCGHSIGMKRGVCSYCGFRSLAIRRQDVKQTIHLVNELRGERRIPQTAYDEVMPALQALARRLDVPAIEPGYRQLVTPRSAAERPVPETAHSETASSDTSPDASPDTLSIVSPTLGRASADAAARVPEDEILDAEVVLADVPADAVAKAATPFATVPHPLDAPEPPEPTATRVPSATFSPRRTMADMLQSFMEEKNIRWGELASGMLIVGSAIGLVISLHEELKQISQQIQYFPALLFMLGTIAIHAAGLYTLRAGNCVRPVEAC